MIQKNKPNWNEILNKSFEELSDEDLILIPQLSHNWRTCPCAVLNVQKDKLGAPLNSELAQLGENFHNKAVQWMCINLQNHRKNIDNPESSNTSLLLAKEYKVKAINILNEINKAIKEPVSEIQN